MLKKSTLKLNLAIILFIAFAISVNAQFTPVRIVVYQIGDGTTPLTAASAPAFLKEYTFAGAAGITVPMPIVGAARLTNSGSANTEGLITLSTNGQFLIVPGYNAPVATATVATTTSATNNRVIDTVSFLAIPGRATTTSTYFSTVSDRSAASDGNNNYWATGASSGICYLGSGTPAIVSNTFTTTRGLSIFNNKLYFTTSSGTRGLYQVGAGAPPTISGVTSTSVIATGGTASPYQFSMNATSDTCYIADDQASAAGGIQKWIYNGATWSLAYTLGTGALNVGARGLTVNWKGGPNPIIFATTAEASANRIIAISDAGVGSPALTLATAGVNTIFRGLAFSPFCTAATINSITSNGPICTNQTLNLNANTVGTGAIAYAWSGTGTFSSNTVKNPSVTGAATGIYTVTATNICGSATSTISVVVNSLPTVTANTSTNTVCAGQPITFTGGGATSYTWSGGVTDGVPFNPPATATYTVAGSDINNCVNTETVSVTVNNLPVVIANANPASLCIGATLKLTGGGATSYTWSSGVSDGVAFSPTVTATYTVAGTDINSCVNTATVNVAVYNLPTVTANTSAAAICTGGTVTLSGGGATTYSWTGGVNDGISFSPSITDSYTVNGTDVNNCVNTATVSVTVNNLPVVTANTTTNTVCIGQAVTLTGGGATTYTWTGGVNDGIAFNPSSTASYTVSGEDANNCVNTATLSVTVNNLPIILANYAPNDTICFGNTVTLNGGGALTYTWTGSVTDGTAFTPSVTATYTVSGTDANGCSDTASILIFVDPCTMGLNSAFASQVEATIYPNPTSGIITLTLRQAQGSRVEIRITNLLGEEAVRLSNPVNPNSQIDVSDLPNGNYFIHISTERNMITKKIVIQK